MTNLSDYIVHYKRRVPADLCDRIVSATESSQRWTKSRVGENEISSYRQCDFVLLGEWPTLDSEFFTHIAEILSDYCSMFPYAEVSRDTGYDVLRYTRDGHYKEHIDSYGDDQRVVSCSVALNDDYEGGEFAFFGKEQMYPLQKGDALIFPSNFLYPHQILPVTEGTRYSIVTWLS